MKRKQVGAILLATSLAVGTLGMESTNALASNVNAVNNEAGTETQKVVYEAVTNSSYNVVSDFEYTGGFARTDLTAYFCDEKGNVTAETVNSSTHECTTAGVIIKIPNGFKYYTIDPDTKTNTLYDIYIKITPTKNNISSPKWTFKITDNTASNTRYMTLQPSTNAGDNFDYEIWLQNGDEVVKDVDLVAGSCYTSYVEGAKPYSSNGTIYTKIPKDYLKYDINTSTWYPLPSNQAGGTNYDQAQYYILGHGKSSDNKIKGGYARKEGTGGAEMVIGYLVKTMTFNDTDGKKLATEKIAENKAISVTPAEPTKEGYVFDGWTTTKDVETMDGKTIESGTPITTEKLKNVKATEDLIFTAHYVTNTAEVNEAGDTVTVNKTDGTTSTEVGSVSISAKDKAYDGKAYTDKEYAIANNLEGANITSVTFYIKKDGDKEPKTETTTENSGAASKGATPVNIGTYFVKATVNTGVAGIKDIYTTFKINPVNASAAVSGTENTYDGTEKTLVSEKAVNGGTVYYSLDGKKYDTKVPTATDADTYTVYYYVKGDSNHNDVASAEKPNTVKAVINKANYAENDVKADSYTGNYDGNAHTISVTAPQGAKVTYSLKEDGQYTDVIPTFTDATGETKTVYYKVEDANHNAKIGTATITINKKKATVTPDDKTKVYGDKDETLTYTENGLVDGETLTGITLARVEGENVGEYAITATQTAGANANYDVEIADGTYTITPKSIIGSTVSLKNPLIYTGKEQTQLVDSVTLDSVVLPEDAYEVTGNVETEPGVYALTITAKENSNYKDSITWNYVISAINDEQSKQNDNEDQTIGDGTVKIEVKADKAVPAISLVTGKEDVLNMLINNGNITADELTQISNGASEDIVLTVSDASETVTSEEKADMQKAAGDYTLAKYLNVNLMKYLTVDGVTQDGIEITETKDSVKVSVQIPDDMLNTDGTLSRSYCLVRYYNGEAQQIEGTYDEKTHTLTFKTNKFGDFALAYKDTKVATPAKATETTTPEVKASEVTASKAVKTSDVGNVSVYGTTAFASLAAIFGSLKIRRKKDEDAEK